MQFIDLSQNRKNYNLEWSKYERIFGKN